MLYDVTLPTLLLLKPHSADPFKLAAQPAHREVLTLLRSKDLPPHPKLGKLVEILGEHFERHQGSGEGGGREKVGGGESALTCRLDTFSIGSSTRAIVFSHFRQSVLVGLG